MKPNTIEIDEKGVFCYEAPEFPTLNKKNDPWYKETGGYKDPAIWYDEKLEQAKRDRVYFYDDDYDDVINAMAKNCKECLGSAVPLGKVVSYLCQDCCAKSKPYPIPDGYKVKIKCQHKGIHNSTCIYHAILVPKEKTNLYYGGGFTDDDIKKAAMEKQQSIEEAAQIQWSNVNRVAVLAFIDGAKSQAAKEYWCNQLIALAKKDGNLINIWEIEQFKQDKS